MPGNWGSNWHGDCNRRHTAVDRARLCGPPGRAPCDPPLQSQADSDTGGAASKGPRVAASSPFSPRPYSRAADRTRVGRNPDPRGPLPSCVYSLYISTCSVCVASSTPRGCFLEVPGVPVGLGVAIVGARVAHLGRSILGSCFVLGRRCGIPGMLCMSLGFLFLGLCSSLGFVFFVSSRSTDVSVSPLLSPLTVGSFPPPVDRVKWSL